MASLFVFEIWYASIRMICSYFWYIYIYTYTSHLIYIYICIHIIIHTYKSFTGKTSYPQRTGIKLQPIFLAAGNASLIDGCRLWCHPRNCMLLAGEPVASRRQSRSHLGSRLCSAGAGATNCKAPVFYSWSFLVKSKEQTMHIYVCIYIYRYFFCKHDLSLSHSSVCIAIWMSENWLTSNKICLKLDPPHWTPFLLIYALFELFVYWLLDVFKLLSLPCLRKHAPVEPDMRKVVATRFQLCFSWIFRWVCSCPLRLWMIMLPGMNWKLGVCAARRCGPICLPVQNGWKKWADFEHVTHVLQVRFLGWENSNVLRSCKR